MNPTTKGFFFGLGCVVISIFILCILPCICIFSILASSAGNLELDTMPIQERTLTESADFSTDKIAVINFSGIITYSVPGDELNQVGATSENIITQLQRAKDDPFVKAVVLRFNSNGGEVVAAEPICREIKAVSAEKPVYSFIDSTGASLAYLLPNCSDYIFARPSSITGSIGVIIQAVDFLGVLERLGGKVTFITNSDGDQKGGNDIFNEGSETYKTYQTILNEEYNYFLDIVAEGRQDKLTREQLKEYADGRIFSGRQAYEAKLVDELAEFDDAISRVIEIESLDKDIKIVEYQIPLDPFANLFTGFNAALNSADIQKVSEEHNSVKVMMVGR